MRANLEPHITRPPTADKIPGLASRRRFCRQTAATALGVVLAPWARPSVLNGKKMTVAASFDNAMKRYMDALDIPGAALAVVRHGQIIYRQGYGWADRDAGELATPDTLFRIASLSKPITALAMLILRRRHPGCLDKPIFELLNLEKRIPTDQEGNWDADFDKRWRRITLRHLLQHTGGWDRDQSFDPMFRAREIARRFGKAGPAGPWDVIRYMLRQPLDFDPGQRYAYSNFGYCLLGRAVEELSGQPYETYVQKHLLIPGGASRMRLGRSLDFQRVPGETRYYLPEPRRVDSVFDDQPAKVSAPYGGFYLEAMDAHGGWLASANDLANLTAALDSDSLPSLSDQSPLLFPDEARETIAPPAGPAWRDEKGRLNEYYYGLGWMLRPGPDRQQATLWHAGSLPGTTSFWARRRDGISYAALFNQRTRRRSVHEKDIDPMLYRAADAVAWDL